MWARELVPLIDAAAQRIYAVVRETELERMPMPMPMPRPPPGAVSPDGVAPAGRGVAFAKFEQRQWTGSFKLRGATNKLMSLDAAAAAAGVITSSTGIHGLGVAAAARQLGIDAEVFLSTRVDPAKRAKMLDLGARLRTVGDDALTAELAARAAAQASGRTYVSPYNDVQVIAGQGTIAVELVRQLPDLDAIFIATGGGGLLSGIGAYLRHAAPRAEIIGCWAENSPVLYECLRAGRIFEVPETPTLSESTAGGVEADSLTFALCREVMHRGVLVSEAEILAAMRWAHALGWAVEGASGVALAAYFKDAARYAKQRVVVLLCGGNPSPAIAALLA